MRKALGSSGKKKGGAKSLFHDEYMRIENEMKKEGRVNFDASAAWDDDKWARLVEIQKRFTEDNKALCTSSTKKKTLSATKPVQVTEMEKKPTFHGRKLFDHATPSNEHLLAFPDKLSDIEECNHSDEGDLNNTNAGIDPINDSTAEFAEYESMCAKEDIFAELRTFIQKQNEEMHTKVMQLMKENNDAIFARIEKVQRQFKQPKADKENVPVKKSANLRVNMMKKSLQLKCPDTPGTKLKMRKAIDMYNSVRQGLDSPSGSVSGLHTPNAKVTAKKALSLKLQKQCLELQE